MTETRQQVTARKIRNGLRKQKAEVERVQQIEKDRVWDILNRDPNQVGYKSGEGSEPGYFYCPYVPIMKGKIFNGDTTA